MKKLLLCLILVQISCSDDDYNQTIVDAENIHLSVLQLGKGNVYSPWYATSEFKVITSQDEYTELKNNLSNNDYFNTPVMIDFNSEVVIAAVDQQGGTYNRTIDITHIYETEQNVVVNIEKLSIGGAQAAVSQPYHFVRIMKPEKPIIFNDLRD